MNNEEYLRELASLLTGFEDVSAPEARDILYELAARVYALLITRLPTSRFDRYWTWPEIRNQLTPQLQAAAVRLGEITFSRLIAAEPAVVQLTTELFDLPEGVIPPRSAERVLDETQVLSTPVSRLFAPEPTTGLTPFSLQLLRLLERTVLAALVSEESTPRLAERVINVRTTAGRRRFVASRGTVANAWADRYRSVLAGALWGLVAPAQQRAAAASQLLPNPPSYEWRWNAILDPRTCPICYPLHNTTALSPQLFPQGPPPLHPRCRCVILPIRI